MLALAACGVVSVGLIAAQSYAQVQTQIQAPAQPPMPSGGANPASGANAAPNAAASAAPAAGAPAAQPPVPVEVIKVGKGSVLEDVSATGTVKANESVMIRPDIVGRIAKINFRDGDNVCRGQVLVELDTSLQQAEKDQTQAELNLALSNFKRNEDLANKNFVSPRVKEEAESQVKVAQAKLALSEARFQRALVRAPFNGVLGLRNVSVGEYVKDGTDLVTLDDLSRLRVDFKLPERYAGQAKVGMKVFVEPDAALKLRGLAGKVDSIDSVLDTNGRALTLRMRIPNPRNLLKPGMFVKTKLVLSEREGALMVPDETVSAQGRDMIVYKVDTEKSADKDKAASSKAVRTVVKTGVRQMGKIEILEGLSEGDVIINAGLQRVNRDGQPVRIVPSGGGGAAGGKPGEGKGAGAGGAAGGSGGKPAGAPNGKPDGKPDGGKPDTAKGGLGKPAGGKGSAGKGADKAELRGGVVCPPEPRDENRGGAAGGRGAGAGKSAEQGAGQSEQIGGTRGPRKP
jgi:membrane fusion protein, multidrug efflux system